MWITWKRCDKALQHPLPFEQKVEIFYEQILGWQLHVADLLANGGRTLDEGLEVMPLKHSGFAVLHICLSYFETVGHYELKKKGRLRSRDYFEAGVRSVFPNLLTGDAAVVDGLLTALYEGARCGLYHNSRTTAGVGLAQPQDGLAIGYDEVTETLAISPERLPKTMKQHLEHFRAKLLDPKNIQDRENFESRFDHDFGV